MNLGAGRSWGAQPCKSNSLQNRGEAHISTPSSLRPAARDEAWSVGPPPSQGQGRFLKLGIVTHNMQTLTLLLMETKELSPTDGQAKLPSPHGLRTALPAGPLWSVEPPGSFKSVRVTIFQIHPGGISGIPQSPGSFPLGSTTRTVSKFPLWAFYFLISHFLSLRPSLFKKIPVPGSTPSHRTLNLSPGDSNAILA